MVLWLLPLILGYGENPLPEMTSLAEAHGIRLFVCRLSDETWMLSVLCSMVCRMWR